MYYFSKISKDRLSTCHSDLQKICNELINYYDFSVFCGHRDKEAQNEAFDKGNSKVKFPNSKHNQMPSLAVDIAPYPPEATKNAEIGRYYMLAGAFLLIAEKLYSDNEITATIRWGGDWDRDKQLSDNNFNDLGHFEIIT